MATCFMCGTALPHGQEVLVPSKTPGGDAFIFCPNCAPAGSRPVPPVAPISTQAPSSLFPRKLPRLSLPLRRRNCRAVSLLRHYQPSMAAKMGTCQSHW